MATLYDLAMQYLNQSLPKTFKYDRTNPPTIGPIIRPPQDPNAPVKRILPVQGGGDGFSVYNPDPNRTRNESNYNERPYKSTVYNDAFPMMGDPMANQATGALNADGLMSYAGDKQLKGLPGAAANYLKNSFVGKGLDALGNMMPVNQRAIYENELLGQGIMLDDIGRIVSDGGNINTAENIMAGYNANKVTAETFQKRRDMINAKMKDPAQKAAKLAALDAAEEKMLGTAKTRADTVFDAKSLEKDPDYVSFDDQLDINNMINTEKEKDEEFDPTALDFTNPNIYKANSIYTQTAPTYITDPYKTGENEKDIGITPPDTTPPGGFEIKNDNDNAGFNPGVNPGTSGFIGLDPEFDVNPFDYDDSGTYDYGGGDQYSDANYMAGDTSSDNTPNPGDTDTFNTETGNENDSGSNTGTHCCTAANERGDMTLLEVKKLRVWHRKQSKIWQRGYDVWGRVMADNLVSKYKWSSDRVRDFYNHKIYGKRTIGSTFADFCIYPMSMIIGSILTVMPPILGYQENKRHGKSSN